MAGQNSGNVPKMPQKGFRATAQPLASPLRPVKLSTAQICVTANRANSQPKFAWNSAKIHLI